MEYELTAYENIAVGDLARADDRRRVVRAAEQAGCHATIDGLPHGYDTMLTRIFAGADEATGTVLSGGQWQRVALARGLLRRDRDLLILDEPSSGLDAEAEYEVHRVLRECRAGRASVLISHRLNAVRDADTIVVLADGVVAEQGTHDSLMEAGGAYATLFARQASGYQLAATP
jgi:ATP-binding cassette subfamily B protein